FRSRLVTYPTDDLNTHSKRTGCATGNATEAAKRAGCSPRTAYSEGQRLLKNVEVKNLLRTHLDEEEVVAGEVLRELKRIALTDRRRVVDHVGKLQPVSQWTAEMAAAVASFEVIVKNAKAGDGHTDVVHKIRFNSKTRALEVLCRHLGLLKPEPDDSGKDVPT